MYAQAELDAPGWAFVPLRIISAGSTLVGRSHSADELRGNQNQNASRPEFLELNCSEITEEPCKMVRLVSLVLSYSLLACGQAPQNAQTIYRNSADSIFLVYVNDSTGNPTALGSALSGRSKDPRHKRARRPRGELGARCWPRSHSRQDCASRS